MWIRTRGWGREWSFKSLFNVALPAPPYQDWSCSHCWLFSLWGTGAASSSAITLASRLITYHSYHECCLESYKFQGRYGLGFSKSCATCMPQENSHGNLCHGMNYKHKKVQYHHTWHWPSWHHFRQKWEIRLQCLILSLKQFLAVENHRTSVRKENIVNK